MQMAMWGVGTLVLGLVVLGCGGTSDGGGTAPTTPTQAPTVTVTPTWHEPLLDLPCGHVVFGYTTDYQGFLEWMHGGEQLLVRYGSRIVSVSTDGSRVRLLADESFGQVGVHADAIGSPARIVYSSCAFSYRDAEAPDPPEGTYDAFMHEHMRRYRGYYHYEVATVALDGSPPQRLTHNSHLDHFPVWSPGGSRIAFLADPGGGLDDLRPALFTMAADGSDGQELAPSLTGRVALAPPVWSPDGQYLAFLVREDAPEDDGREITALYSTGADGSELQRIGRVSGVPSWSPDSQYLAFARDGGDARGLYVSTPDGSEVRRVFPAAGTVPLEVEELEVGGDWTSMGEVLPHVSWSPDGTRILFASPEFRLVRWGDGSISRWKRIAINTISPDGLGLQRIRLPEEVVGDGFFGSLYGLAWSPDGARVAVHADRGRADGPGEFLLTVAPDGTGAALLAYEGKAGLLVAAAPAPGAALDRGSCSAGVLVAEPEANPGLVADCEALVAARDTLAGGATLRWGDGPLRDWEGVSIGGSPPRVRELDLRGFTLTGTIPPVLGQLSALERLDLSYNVLDGAIPPELGNLSNLRVLNLAGNLLTGHIPREFGGLTELRELRLARNDLGRIPWDLTGLQHLTVLGLELNPFLACIPGELMEILESRFRLSEC